MNTRKAMTLLEIIIMVIVLGILVSIAIAQFNKAVLKARVENAWANLRLIRAAQKIYFRDNGAYADADSVAQLKSLLGIELEETYWDYKAENIPPNRIGVAGYPTIGFADYGYCIGEAGTITCCLGSCPY